MEKEKVLMFIVETPRDEESTEIVGVFSSYEKAEEYMNKELAKLDEKYRHSLDTFYVTILELDKGEKVF